MVPQFVILFLNLCLGFAPVHAQIDEPAGPLAALAPAAGTVITTQAMGEEIKIKTVVIEGEASSRWGLNQIFRSLRQSRLNEAVVVLSTLAKENFLVHLDPGTYRQQTLLNPHSFAIFDIPFFTPERTREIEAENLRIKYLTMARRQTAVSAVTYIFLSGLPVPTEATAILLALVMNTEMSLHMERWNNFYESAKTQMQNWDRRLGVPERILKHGAYTFTADMTTFAGISFVTTNLFSGVHAWNHFGNTFLNWQNFKTLQIENFFNNFTAVFTSGAWTAVFMKWRRTLDPAYSQTRIQLSQDQINESNRWKGLLMASLGPAIRFNSQGAKVVAGIGTVAALATIAIPESVINKAFSYFSIDLGKYHGLGGFRYTPWDAEGPAGTHQHVSTCGGPLAIDR